MVEVRGFEPLLREPKSLVLPLHHTSIRGANIEIFYDVTKFRLNRDFYVFLYDFIKPEIMIWIIIIATMVLSLVVQNGLTRKIKKYSKVDIGLSGAEVAERMLRENGITDVKVTCTGGFLTDHYNPSTKVVNLSKEVYEGRNVSAAAVAAHECGHAVQHATKYLPLGVRSALVPVVNFASMTVQFVLLMGVLMLNTFPQLIWIGIGLFAITTLFSFITLPVEINASARAVKWLENAGITTYETKPMAVSALKWAAYTYVIAAIGSLATLLYYISLAQRR